MKFTEDPYVKDTQGLSKLDDTKKQELKATEVVNQEMSELRSNEVKAAEPKGVSTWSNYPAEKV